MTGETVLKRYMWNKMRRTKIFPTNRGSSGKQLCRGPVLAG